MPFQPAFQDIAHLGHVELFTPKPEESLAFFTNIVGLHESGCQGDSVYLRAWGDYEVYSLKLTAAQTSGMGHVAFRTKIAEVLTQLVDYLTKQGVTGTWLDSEYGHGPAFRVASPDGHPVELYYETARFVPPPALAPGFKNQPQRYIPHGIAPRQLDHINILAQDVQANRVFFHELLGLRVTEQIIFDDGTEVGAWLACTIKSHDFTITQDRSNARGRFHHLAYFMDSREDVLRAADILVENSVAIETGPHKHTIGQSFFLYCYEPGGNRFEAVAGGYLILAPDWQPVVWTQAERAKGQAWGLQTVQSCHTYGTPPVE